MRILVTGAAGFLGNNIVDYLYARGYEIWGTYHNTVPEHRKGIHYLQCDLAKEIPTDECFDAVIHLAAHMDANKQNGKMENESHGGVKGFLQDSVYATKTVVEFCENLKIPKLLFFSTISVYGEADSVVDENSDKKNLNIYGMAKLFSESLVQEAKIPSKVILRCPRILGRGADLSFPWLPALAAKLLAGEEVRYFNPDLMYNNLADVEDIAAFCDELLKCRIEGTEIFVVGSADYMSVYDIIICLRNALESTSALTVISPPKTNTVYAVDNSKALMWGYQPRTTEEILKRFAKYVMEGKQ